MSKKRHDEEEVTLNVTAMLDMAFQLLAFFVLTFKPAPLEGQILMKLPPAQAVLGAGGQSAGNDETKDPKDIKPVKTLTVSLLDDGGGSVTDVRIGVPSLGPLQQITYNDLEGQLRDWIQKQGFDQLVIQSTPTLRWSEVMRVVNMCTSMPQADGKTLPSVSLIAIGDRTEQQ